MVTRLRVGPPRNRSSIPEGYREIFPFSGSSRPALWPIQRVQELFPRGGGRNDLGVKLTSPSSAEVRNEWSLTSAPAYVVIAWPAARLPSLLVICGIQVCLFLRGGRGYVLTCRSCSSSQQVCSGSYVSHFMQQMPGWCLERNTRFLPVPSGNSTVPLQVMHWCGLHHRES